MPIDYEVLRIIWWLLLGVLLIGFAVTDGFDLGAMMLLPWVAKSDMERRVVINSIAPTWEGNQVWLILGGGAIFAAWPPLYAVSLSGFYLAMLVVLLALILRPVAFKFRSKVKEPKWRSTWDTILFSSSVIAVLIFGIAVGNVLQGVPFHFDNSLRLFYTGSFLGLLNPFALLCGLLSIVMLLMHGGAFLVTKTQGVIQERSRVFTRHTSLVLVILFAVAGLWVAFLLQGYMLDSSIAHDGPSNPLYKTAHSQLGAWIYNYMAYPVLFIVPLSAFLGALLVRFFTHKQYDKRAFLASGLSVAGVIATVGVSMFPFILPSSSKPSHSLLVWDASSSQLTLLIMFIATVVFMPIVLLYTAWVYRVLRGKVTEQTIDEQEDVAY